MVEIDGTLALIGECGKGILIARYFMWNCGPACAGAVRRLTPATLSWLDAAWA